MPNFFSLLLFLCFTVSEIRAADSQESVFNFLKQSPATVSGLIAIEQNIDLYNKKVVVEKNEYDFKMKLNSGQPIGFNFSEDHLTILPDKSISISINGHPVKLDYIQFERKNGEFVVKSNITYETLKKIPFISDYIKGKEEKINKALQEELKAQFKEKLNSAFDNLSKIRQAKNMDDVDKVSQTIADIFSSGKNPTALPVIKGTVSLNFQPEKGRSFHFEGDKPKVKGKKREDFYIDISAHDNLMAGISFVKKDGKTNINGIELASTKGIRLHLDTGFPEIASVNVSELKFSEHGPYLVYDIGLEETIVGFQLVSGLLKSMSGRGPSAALAECDPVVLKSVRQRIDGEFRIQLSKMVKIHRKALLQAGATPELLSALE